MKNIIYASLFLFCIPLSSSAEPALPLEKLSPLANAISLEKIENKRVLLYFWASWCPDCREKLSGPIPSLQKEFPHATVIAVNMDRDGAKGKAFIDSEKISLPVFRDEEKIFSKGLKLFAVPAWAAMEKTKAGEWVALKSSTGSDLAEIRSALGK